jgi:CRISPR-associated protein Csx14
MTRNNHYSPTPTTMIATLGGQPQVVTFALDALLARGEPISELYVLHLALENPRTRQSLARLSEAFVDDHYAGRRCRFRRVPIGPSHAPLYDIHNEHEAELLLQTVRELLAGLKQQGHKLHLCISGGRRMIGLLVMSAAALLCDHQDRLWHMYTPDDFRRRAEGGAILHAQPEDGVQLIQIPLVPWGAYFPALRGLAQTPVQHVAQQLHWLVVDEQQCRQVYGRLSQRQREILHLFARGHRPQDVAEALHITLSTVNTHKTAILAECRAAWAIADDEPLDYRFLRERFAAYVQQIDPV